MRPAPPPGSAPGPAAPAGPGPQPGRAPGPVSGPVSAGAPGRRSGPRPGPAPGNAPGPPAPAAPAVPLAVLGAVLGAFACVRAVDPNHPGHYPVCPLLHYTGVYCPACGGLRSAYAVAHGHFGTALGCNALAVAGYLLFAVLWAVWFGRCLRRRDFVPGLPTPWAWAVGGIVVTFTLVRNLPFGAGLAP
jgi:Protein of unknown function (DUF2752)